MSKVSPGRNIDVTDPVARAVRRALVPGALAVFALAARAQAADSSASGSGDAGTDQLAEIVVTATRQAEPLSHVAASVAAITQATLDSQGVRQIDDISRLVPGITFQRQAFGNSDQSNIAIRGIISNSGVPTTGVYIDDVPVQIRIGSSVSVTNPYPRVFDLDRVEVLRGPQGTLFGAGSEGGAVRFITPTPSLTQYSTYVRSEVAATENGGMSSEIGVAAGGPIVQDQLGARASLWYRHDGGYVDRVDRATGDVLERNANSGDDYSGRVAFYWAPTAELSVTPSIFFQKTRQHDGSAYYEAVSNPGAGIFAQNSYIPEPNADRFYLPALKLQYNFGSASVIYDGSYLSRSAANVIDGSYLDLASFAGINGPPPPALQSYLTRSNLNNREENVTHELRIQNNDPTARFNWIGGLFFSRQLVNDYYGAADPDLLGAVNYGITSQGGAPVGSLAEVFGANLYQNLYALYLTSQTVDVQKAVFAQADFRLTQRLKLTVGGRYTRSTFTNPSFDAGPVVSSDGDYATIAEKASSFTPKFGVAYQADERNLFYASAAKGFREGLAAGPVGDRCALDAAALGIDPDATNAVKPDSVWSYEAGSKNRLWHDRLSLDASVYYIKWSNIQTQIYLPNCGVPTTFNSGDAVSKGFDLSASIRALEGLSFTAAIGYDNARYTTPLLGPDDSVLIKVGEPLPGIAPWSGYVASEYDVPFAGHQAYVRLDDTFTTHDGTPLNVSSPLVDPSIPRPEATNMLNLRAGLRIEGMDVSLFVANALDSHPSLARYEDTLAQQYFRDITFRPRTIGVTFTLNR